MNKLFGKKISFFGREVSVFALVLIGMVALASAALVPYVSNIITGTATVSSPIFIDITNSAENGCSLNSATGEWICNKDLYGGDYYVLDTTLENRANTNSTPLLTEIKISAFDGEGINVYYADEGYEGDVPGCVNGTDYYYYIGPETGFIIPANTKTAGSQVQIRTAFNLMPQSYTSTTRVITLDNRVCNPTTA